MSTEWPLVGRSEELRLIGERLGRGRDARAGVVLAGGAGVGKTRLAREVLRGAARAGTATRWVCASASARGLPLGAFAPLLGEVAGRDAGELLRRTADAVVGDRGGRVVVLGVDDVHLLDDLSALLVQQLALRPEVKLVLTLRSGETAPDAVTSLWKDHLLDRLEIQPFSRLETDSLLERVLGGHMDAVTSGRLWSFTRGNALYLRQLVDGERDAGRLAWCDGVWCWRGEATMAPSLLELVESRMGQLPERIGLVVELLALAEPLPLTVVTGMAGADAVERAETRGLIVAGPGQDRRVRLSHPLYGQARLARCGRLRARRLRGQLSTALADVGGDAEVLRRAVLAVDSDLAPTTELLAAATALALGLLDFELAARLGQAAAVGGGFEATLLWGYALAWSGRGAEAEEALAALWTSGITPDELGEAMLPRGANLFFNLAQPERAEDLLDEALRSIGSPPPLLLLAWRSCVDALRGRPHRARAAAEQVLNSADATSVELCVACWGALAARSGAGDLSEVDRIGRRAQAVAAGGASLPLARVGPGLHWLRAFLYTGELDRAEELMIFLRAAAADDIGVVTLIHDVMAGQLARERGLVRTAARLLRSAGAGLLGHSPGGWAYYVPLQLTSSLALAGELDEAQKSLAVLRASRHPSFVIMQPEDLLAQAWVAAASGVTSDGIARARDAASLAASQSQHALEVCALHTAACFGDRTVADRLTELAGRVDGPRAPAAAAHATALTADDGEALMAASAQLERSGALLLAADAAAQAAQTHYRQGRQGSANLAVAHAHRLAEVCEGARTPALAVLTAPARLTDREREVANLAAAGLSNRQIADRLTVSVRTVEGHIYRISGKLGTSNRAALADLLGPPATGTRRSRQ